MSAELKGSIERVVFRSPNSAWTVAVLDDGTTVVGELPDVEVGDPITFVGAWRVDPKYGRQFQVERAELVLPTTAEGLERFLGSGIITGIGPALAGRIVAAFEPAELLHALNTDPEALTRVDGIGPKRARSIAEKWSEKAEFRSLMVFLQGFGLSATWATRLIRHYGHEVVGVIRRNPYQLIRDVQGIGFRKADEIAQKVGIDERSEYRIEAALIFVLGQSASEGHLYATEERLLSDASKWLGVDLECVTETLFNLCRDERIIVERLADPEGRIYYLPRLYRAEVESVARLRRLIAFPSTLADRLPTGAELREIVRTSASIELAPNQEAAVQGALSHKVALITGGPGTGKTTITRGVITILQQLRARIALAAPTGRAAKRLSEATGAPASTIHRLLEYSPKSNAFERNEDDPLECDVLILDEFSMVDMPLFLALLAAIPPDAHLIIVGDADQLPSVGPGNVLGDLLASGAIASYRLTTIFRQAEQSLIVRNAHRINAGEVPIAESSDGDDYFFVERKTPESMVATLIELIDRLEQRFGLNAIEDLQVLTPMHKGLCGTRHLNEVLQQKLNPDGRTEELGQKRFRVGDRVMQIQNNYDKDVFNGDVGRLIAITDDDLSVAFDRREVRYQRDEVDELSLAYAVTVHKSQGSEYPAVIILLHNEHYLLLQRNLVYTALTRARNVAVVLGSRRAMSLAVRNDKVRRRNTQFAKRLIEELV
ncbi:MAG: ATP-dependent RecD-like DNA helicase [Myxococcales bacterium]|nr:ATP-dependent RecD-like DNA helicase [Myxococcales bacterium]